MDDGLLEIVGLRNLAHVIRIRLGAGAVKLAQGRQIRIELNHGCRPLAFQVRTQVVYDVGWWIILGGWRTLETK